MSIILLRNDIFMFLAYVSIGSPTENFINEYWQEK